MHIIAARYLRSSLSRHLRRIHRTARADSKSPSLQTCYAILGVDASATQDEIKDAYIEKCKKYHPDLHQGNLEMQQMFIEVKEAYQKLSQPATNGSIDTGYRTEDIHDFHAFYPKWKTKPKAEEGFNPFAGVDFEEKDRKYANDANYYKKEYFSEENKTGTLNLYKIFILFLFLQVISSFVYYSRRGSSFTFHDEPNYDQFPQRFLVSRSTYKNKAEPTKRDRVDFVNKDPRMQRENADDTDSSVSQK